MTEEQINLLIENLICISLSCNEIAHTLNAIKSNTRTYVEDEYLRNRGDL